MDPEIEKRTGAHAPHPAATAAAEVAPAVARLHEFVTRHPRLLVLTGAGASTGAGIPAYRDRRGEWMNPAPIRFGEFRRSRDARQRYWARSFRGWPRFAAARPAPAHVAIAALQRAGWIGGVVTQNVDGLHSLAGSAGVVDLHGRLSRVVCLDCPHHESRDALQRTLAHLNPDAPAVPAARLRPDGDTEVHAAAVAGFRFPDCPACGGVLKPDVVFFGENVPAARVARVRELLSRAPALLVVGSSLMVLSGYRFVREATAAATPVAVLTAGRTRADGDGVLKLDAECGASLAGVARALGATAAATSPSATAAGLLRDGA